MTTKKTTTLRTPSAKKAAKKAPKRQGNLQPKSRSSIAFNARLAFDIQESMGNIETGVTFDQWRQDQVMAAVGRPGISACDGHHYRALMVHFLVLANREDEALKFGLKTGRVKDHGDASDTHEAREQWVALIYNDVSAHIALADTAEADVLDGDRVTWTAIKNNGGPIREGYVAWIAKDKFGFRRPYQKLIDLEAHKLEQLLYTVRNRIAAKEGRGTSKSRNKSQNEKK